MKWLTNSTNLAKLFCNIDNTANGLPNLELSELSEDFWVLILIVLSIKNNASVVDVLASGFKIAKNESGKWLDQLVVE